MSYNIDNVDCKVLDAWIYAKDLHALLEQLEGELAEGNFLDEMFEESPKEEWGELPYDPATKVKLRNFWWYGEGSGRSYDDVLLPKIVPYIHGYVEAIFTWEGGDAVSGLIIKDGVATECDIEMKLVPKKPKNAKKKA